MGLLTLGLLLHLQLHGPNAPCPQGQQEEQWEGGTEIDCCWHAPGGGSSSWSMHHYRAQDHHSWWWWTSLFWIVFAQGQLDTMVTGSVAYQQGQWAHDSNGFSPCDDQFKNRSKWLWALIEFILDYSIDWLAQCFNTCWPNCLCCTIAGMWWIESTDWLMAELNCTVLNRHELVQASMADWMLWLWLRNQDEKPEFNAGKAKQKYDVIPDILETELKNILFNHELSIYWIQKFVDETRCHSNSLLTVWYYTSNWLNTHTHAGYSRALPLGPSSITNKHAQTGIQYFLQETATKIDGQHNCPAQISNWIIRRQERRQKWIDSMELKSNNNNLGRTKE